MKTTKERPLLFSAPMVRAILDGTKTQTRRIVKPQPPTADYKLSRIMSTTGNRRDIDKLQWVTVEDLTVTDRHGNPFACPYGVPGDRLWVRETWGYADPYPVQRNGDQKYALPKYIKPTDDILLKFWRNLTAYRATEPNCPYLLDGWRPSIYMPRWASRLTLEIVRVRVERLQDISEEDAKAEGVLPVQRAYGTGWHDYTGHSGACVTTAKVSYLSLWESINGPGSWEANPWVWVVEFKKMEGEIALGCGE